jgi:type III secretion protein D
MAWKIRFYSGLNQGVEVPLPGGRVVIGSDPLQADLVVVDPGIAAIHLVLDVDAQGVRMLEWAESNPPAQGGEPLNGGSALQALAAQTCGPLLWAYCSQEQSFSKQLMMSPINGEGRTARSRLKWGGLVMAGISLLIFISAMVFFSQPGASDQRRMIDESPLVARRTFLREKRFTHVEAGIAQEGGSVPVSGYLDDNRARLDLQQYLEQSGLNFQMDVRSMEDIRNDADFILHKVGHQDVQSNNADRPGWIRLSGAAVQEEESWPELEALLKADVPGLLGVEAQEKLPLAPLKRLEQLLKDYGLATALISRDEGENIELDGELDDSQRKQFSRMQQQFDQEFGNRLSLRLVSSRKSSGHQDLVFNVRSVSLGQVPYVVLSDNQKYPVGALTSAGVRVLSINRSEIVVSKGSQKFIIKLKGGALNDEGVGGGAVEN